MTRSPRPRKTSSLSDSLHRQLNMYALAAIAAGVEGLALPQAAEAKIVYTPAHVNVPRQGNYCFDLDHDGNRDVRLLRNAHYYNTYVSAAVAGAISAGGIAVSHSGLRRAFELAIFRGARIGPARHFTNYSFDTMADGNSSKGTFNVRWFGPWANAGKGVSNRYLGIKFIAGDGHFHYGWARLTVTIDNPKINQISRVLLTGYAYETIPGRAIIAGATHGTDDAEPTPAGIETPTREPATLGMLTLGAPGLSIWRREESAIPAQPNN